MIQHHSFTPGQVYSYWGDYVLSDPSNVFFLYLSGLLSDRLISSSIYALSLSG